MSPLPHFFQNCYLQVTEATIRSPSSSTFVYEVAVGSICQTLRNPRFLMHVRDESGELPELVVECLLEHGRLRVEQVSLRSYL